VAGPDSSARIEASGLPPVLTVNTDGASPFVLICDHASNRIPPEFAALGVDPIAQLSHIAWDPGALAVCLELVELLDAPLIHSTISRLVVDCNRRLDAPDLMPARSEATDVPGNRMLSPDDRRRRIEAYHRPYHAEIEALLAARSLAGRRSLLVCMHSFTPVYNGVARRWPIGLLPARDERLTRALAAALAAEAPDLDVGWNEPYSSFNGVSYTVEHHGDGRGLEATMIEIRNDEIRDPAGVTRWAALLARCLEAARLARCEVVGGPAATTTAKGSAAP
jgi:predicted N-formylglutamate amidohydrolase